MKRIIFAIVFACLLLPTAAKSDGIGPKPGRWCGWFMQHELGITSKGTGLNLNRAIEWARVGSPTTASVGAVVVWRHHVGVIVGKGENGRWIVKSGNDGNRVRTRERSLHSAVAFRSVGSATVASYDNNSLDQKASRRGKKNLVALAVGGRAVEPLGQPGTLAVGASVSLSVASAPPAHLTDFTDEVRRKKRKPVRQPQRPVLVAGMEAGQPVHGVLAFGEKGFSHDVSPRTRLAQGDARPSSRALQGSARSKLHARAGLEFGGHALYVDAGVEMTSILRPEQSPDYRRPYRRGLPTEVTASRRASGRR